MIAEYLDVICMRDGECVVTVFVGEDRLERALRHAQGLFDQHIVCWLRERPS